jgi:hypothetical protein
MPDQRIYDVQDQQLTSCLINPELVMPLSDYAHWNRSGRERRERVDQMSSLDSAVDSPHSSLLLAEVSA